MDLKTFRLLLLLLCISMIKFGNTSCAPGYGVSSTGRCYVCGANCLTCGPSGCLTCTSLHGLTYVGLSP